MAEFSELGFLRRLWLVESGRADGSSNDVRKFRRCIEVFLIVAVSLGIFSYGALTYLQNLQSAAFYQSTFGPALNLACTGRLAPFEPTGQARQFLDVQRFDLPSCREITESKKSAWNFFDRSTIYLYLLAALSWSIFGIRWSSLFLVAGFLSALFALANYGLLRLLFPGRTICAIFAVTVVVSRPALVFVEHLRDYSKAGFIIGALALLGAAVLRPYTPGRRLLLGLASGALVGIGLGFRNDIDVIVPIAILSPLLLVCTGSWRHCLKSMVAVWAGFGAGYLCLLSLRYALVPLPEDAPTFVSHYFVLGFADSFFAALKMLDAPYSAVSDYNDIYVYGVTSLFGHADALHPIPWQSARYDSAARDLFLTLLLTTPNDALLRIFYAANAVGHFPTNRAIWGFVFPIAMVLIAATGLRALLFVIGSFAALIAIMTLQYDLRHAFYLAVFGPAVAVMSIKSIAELRAARPHLRTWLVPGRGAVIACIAIASFGVGSTAAMSWFSARWQTRALAETLASYRGLHWNPIQYDRQGSKLLPSGTALLGDNHVGNLDAEKWRSPQGAGREFAAFSRLRLRTNSGSGTAIPPAIIWQAVQGDVLHQTGGRFEVHATHRGYVVRSNPIEAKTPTPSLSPGSSGTVVLRISGETLSGVAFVGVLDDKSKNWTNILDNKMGHMVSDPQQLESKWSVDYTIDIPSDIDSYSIIFSNWGESTPLELKIDEVMLKRYEPKDCDLSDLAITKLYRDYRNSTRLPEIKTNTTSGGREYYFPMLFYANLFFEGLDISGIDPACVEDWSIADGFPKGLAPIEMLVTKEGLARDHRGQWSDILLDFFT